MIEINLLPSEWIAKVEKAKARVEYVRLWRINNVDKAKTLSRNNGRRYLAKHGDERNRSDRERRKIDPDYRARRNATTRKWSKNNPEKLKGYYRKRWPKIVAKTAVRLRKSHLMKKYKLTLAQFDSMVKAQSGLCLICGAKPKLLCVDHDHTTGKVRGLLCRKCNTGLGSFSDDASLLSKAVEYLKTK